MGAAKKAATKAGQSRSLAPRRPHALPETWRRKKARRIEIQMKRMAMKARGGKGKSALDTVSERRIQEAIDMARKDRTIILWDSRSLEEFARLSDHTDEVRSLAFSPDGRTLASGARDRTVRLWDLASRRGIAILTGHSGSVDSLRFSPDGSILATCATRTDDRAEVFLWPVSLEESKKSPPSLHPH